mmetsp:Transcript_31488/g.82610  ORF Transcript_31488/g.82610 Transcript_31488/m.82610 type:complete len:236 (+) Transcript_31488:1009-1716(+)
MTVTGMPCSPSFLAVSCPWQYGRDSVTNTVNRFFSRAAASRSCTTTREHEWVRTREPSCTNCTPFLEILSRPIVARFKYLFPVSTSCFLHSAKSSDASIFSVIVLRKSSQPDDTEVILEGIAVVSALITDLIPSRNSESVAASDASMYAISVMMAATAVAVPSLADRRVKNLSTQRSRCPCPMSRSGTTRLPHTSSTVRAITCFIPSSSSSILCGAPTGGTCTKIVGTFNTLIER